MKTRRISTIVKTVSLIPTNLLFNNIVNLPQLKRNLFLVYGNVRPLGLIIFFKHNCEFYNPSLESVGAEPLTMTSAAAGSVLLTTEFSTKCPIEKICFNQRLKTCCSLVKIGRQWRCPKFCFQTRRS